MMRKRKAPPKRRFNVYVIALNKKVLKSKKFLEDNPDYKDGKPCVYVGMTARAPEERFEQHKKGYKSGRFIKHHGEYLRRKLYEKYNPMTYEEAKRRERQLAEDLRRKGYAVHWN